MFSFLAPATRRGFLRVICLTLLLFAVLAGAGCGGHSAGTALDNLDSKGAVPTGGPVKTSLQVTEDEYEPDDTSGQAQQIGFTIAEQFQFRSIDVFGDVDWYKFTGQPGVTYTVYSTTEVAGLDTFVSLYNSSLTEIAFDDDSGDGLCFNLSYSPTSAGTYYIKVKSVTGTGDYYFHWYSTTDGPDAYEADNSSGVSKVIAPTTAPQSQNRTLDVGGDVDWVKIDALAGVTYFLQTTGSTDTVGTLYNSALTQVATDDDSGAGTNFKLTYTPAASGTLFLKVAGKTGSTTGSYVLVFSQLSVPTGVQASDGALTDHVHVSWNSVVGATGYKVWRAASQNGAYTLLASPAGTQYDDFTGVSTPWWYKISATNSVGESGQSAGSQGNAGLAAPTGVSASDGTFTDHVHITWNTVSGATSYKVFRATSQNGVYGQITTTTLPQFDNYISFTATYWYAIKATNASGDSWFSTANGGNATVAAPLNVQATDGAYTDHVRVTWNAVAGATGYEVFRFTPEQGGYLSVGNTGTTQFDDYVGTTAWYKVRTLTPAGYSYMSVINEGFPSLAWPGGVEAGDGVFSDRIRTTWFQVNGATSYKVFRSTSEDGTYTQIGTTTNVVFDDFISGTIWYWYRIKAVSPDGDSWFSGADRGYASVVAPYSVQASDGTFTNHVHVTWHSIAGATMYKVYRSSALAGPYTQIGTSGTPAYDDFIGDTDTYFYRIVTVKSIGDSCQSASIDSGFES